jgi:hypothetical protein
VRVTSHDGIAQISAIDGGEVSIRKCSSIRRGKTAARHPRLKARRAVGSPVERRAGALLHVPDLQAMLSRRSSLPDTSGNPSVGGRAAQRRLAAEVSGALRDYVETIAAVQQPRRRGAATVAVPRAARPLTCV